MEKKDRCGFYTVRYEPCSSGCVSYHFNCARDVGSDGEYIECVALSDCEYTEKVIRGTNIIAGCVIGSCILCAVSGFLCSKFCKKEGENYGRV